MHDSNLNLCMGCMSPLDDSGGCLCCDYREGDPVPEGALPPHTVLAGRYLVGKVLRRDAEGALYIGYDLEEDMRLWLRECYPPQLARRQAADSAIRPQPGCEVAFKTMLAAYEELYKKLESFLPGEAMVPFLRALNGAGTVYGVFKAPAGRPLVRHLAAEGGELNWGDCKKPFLALCNTVGHLHKAGVLHAGISPENIWVDDRGRMLLTGFATSALRTEGSGIAEELFAGYSAPEQYSGQHWQDRCTDVYALAALLYRCLTGTMPPDAESRARQDNLTPAAALTGAVPQNVSGAIEAAMRLTPSARTQAVEQFTAMLLEDSSTNTAIFSGPIPAGGDGAAKKPRRMSAGAMLFAAVLVVSVVAGAWALINLAGSYNPGGQSEQSSRSLAPVPEPHYVPSFTGMMANRVINESDLLEHYNFSLRRVFSDRYADGVIISQMPDPGVKMINKGTVILTVSLGPEVMPMPNLVGSQLSFAMQMLADLKISYNILPSDDAQARPGLVVSTSIPAGEDINRTNDVVILYIGQDRPESSSSSGSSGPFGS